MKAITGDDASQRRTAANVVPLRLVSSQSASNRDDLLRCLQELTKRAERGEIIGLSFAAMQADREFFLSNCGEAHQNAAYAASMASALWYANMKKVFGDE